MCITVIFRQECGTTYNIKRNLAPFLGLEDFFFIFEKLLRIHVSCESKHNFGACVICTRRNIKLPNDVRWLNLKKR